MTSLARAFARTVQVFRVGRELLLVFHLLRCLETLNFGGRPCKARYQFVLKSVNNEDLRRSTDGMRERLRADPMFRNVSTDAQLKGLQARLEIDRERASALGVNMQDIRTALYGAFGERQIGTIYTSTDSYQVIMLVADGDRADESAFSRVYVRARRQDRAAVRDWYRRTGIEPNRD